MKDAYSFHVDLDDLKRTYQDMYDAYTRVFERCALTFRAGRRRGGRRSAATSTTSSWRRRRRRGRLRVVHELRLRRQRRGRARRASRAPSRGAGRPTPAREKVHTPGMPGIAAVAEHLGVPEDELLKSIAFDLDGEVGLALVPGDREVNPAALALAVAPRKARLFDDDDFAAHPELPKGYIGADAPGVALVVADPLVAAARWVTGANEVDHHVRNAVRRARLRRRAVGRPREPSCPAIRARDAARRCRSTAASRSGTSSSSARSTPRRSTRATPTSRGEQHPMVMGCYGIGISRIVTAVVEEHHDDNGITWPAALAPYDVISSCCPARATRLTSSPPPIACTTSSKPRASSVLYDDRDASPGVKFADADLLGMPVRSPSAPRAWRGHRRAPQPRHRRRRRAPARRAPRRPCRRDAAGSTAGVADAGEAHARCRRATSGLYEPKWDGFRCIVFRDGDDVELGSRNERPLTRYFPEILDPLRAALADRPRRRDRDRDRARARLRPAVAAHPPGGEPRQQARRRDAVVVRRLRPARRG